MLSRALILAAVTVMLGLLAEAPAGAQNLEAGKTPAAIFSSTCSICHKSARGLIKSVSPGSLPGFLRQHYTTSSEMASSLSAFVLANGAATAAAPSGNLTKQGQASRTAPKPSDGSPEQAAKDSASGRKPTREASRPDADGLSAPQTASQEADGAKPDASKQGAKSKSAKGRQKADQAKLGEPKEEPKADTTRPDPVPQVTPAGSETPAPTPSAPKSVAELPTGPLTIDIQPPAKPDTPAAIASTPAGPPAGRPAVPISE